MSPRTGDCVSERAASLARRPEWALLSEPPGPCLGGLTVAKKKKAAKKKTAKKAAKKKGAKKKKAAKKKTAKKS
jgi:hypothetical protein